LAFVPLLSSTKDRCELFSNASNKIVRIGAPGTYLNDIKSQARHVKMVLFTDSSAAHFCSGFARFAMRLSNMNQLHRIIYLDNSVAL
jgi:hypothetical protein